MGRAYADRSRLFRGGNGHMRDRLCGFSLPYLGSIPPPPPVGLSSSFGAKTCMTPAPRASDRAGHRCRRSSGGPSGAHPPSPAPWAGASTSSGPRISFMGHSFIKRSLSRQSHSRPPLIPKYAPAMIRGRCPEKAATGAGLPTRSPPSASRERRGIMGHGSRTGWPYARARAPPCEGVDSGRV